MSIIRFFSWIEIDWKQYSDGIAMILFQGDINYATGHGVVKLGDKVLLVTTVISKCSRKNTCVRLLPGSLNLCYLIVVCLSFSSENCYDYHASSLVHVHVIMYWLD